MEELSACNLVIEKGSSNKFANGGDKENTSLQANFAKFLEDKKQQRRLMKRATAATGGTAGNRTQEFKDKLRQKFIDQALSYLGVPYSKKHHPQDLPLYLDCCGLVRQVLKDLREEFCFVTGKWNQAYQFDTLPIRLNSIHDLKPGDLIFYQGPYKSERSKKQKHDMVHVEIFYPGETGEGTIGSRYAKSGVDIFPSYKFPSNLWSLENVYFCSIETWLNGQCVSHCSEHSWKCHTLELAAAAGSKSIFNDGDCSDEDEDVSAGGDEGDQEA
jgi:hypothetical protein